MSGRDHNAPGPPYRRWVDPEERNKARPPSSDARRPRLERGQEPVLQECWRGQPPLRMDAPGKRRELFPMLIGFLSSRFPVGSRRPAERSVTQGELVNQIHLSF